MQLDNMLPTTKIRLSRRAPPEPTKETMGSTARQALVMWVAEYVDGEPDDRCERVHAVVVEVLNTKDVMDDPTRTQAHVARM